VRAAIGAVVVVAGLCEGVDGVHAQARQNPLPALYGGYALRAGFIEASPDVTPRCATLPGPGDDEVSCATLAWAFVPEEAESRAGRIYGNHHHWAASTWLLGTKSDVLPATPERTPMGHGFELPPRRQMQADYEVFKLIANLTRIRIAQRSYGDDLEKMGPFRSVRELEAARDRGTYLDIEEYVGHPDENKVSPLFLAGGLSLTVLSGALALLDWDEVEGVGSDARVRPNGWPPGLRIKGHFSWP
jgi:hypothetical protein